MADQVRNREGESDADVGRLRLFGETERFDDTSETATASHVSDTRP